MAVRDILILPDKRLRLVSKPVARIDAATRALVEDMFETMYDAPGIGLAAIQIAQPLTECVDAGQLNGYATQVSYPVDFRWLLPVGGCAKRHERKAKRKTNELVTHQSFLSLKPDR